MAQPTTATGTGSGPLVLDYRTKKLFEEILPSFDHADPGLAKEFPDVFQSKTYKVSGEVVVPGEFMDRLNVSAAYATEALRQYADKRVTLRNSNTRERPYKPKP